MPPQADRKAVCVRLRGGSRGWGKHSKEKANFVLSMPPWTLRKRSHKHKKIIGTNQCFVFPIKSGLGELLRNLAQVKACSLIPSEFNEKLLRTAADAPAQFLISLVSRQTHFTSFPSALSNHRYKQRGKVDGGKRCMSRSRPGCTWAFPYPVKWQGHFTLDESSALAGYCIQRLYVLKEHVALELPPSRQKAASVPLHDDYPGWQTAFRQLLSGW